jgi:hypothetical protein
MSDVNKIDENILRRLAYIKGLFRIGSNHLSRATEPNLAVATLLFDNCIEMWLWLLADKHKIKITGERFLLQLLDDITNNQSEKEIKLLYENRSAIKELHLARNSVQHNGIVPAFIAVQRYESTTEKVLSNSIQSSFGLPWGNISLALLINESQTRDLYSEAENRFEKGKYADAALLLVATFEHMKSLEIDRRYGSGIFMKRLAAQLSINNCQDVNTKYIAEYAKAIEREVEILKLGVDYKGYQRYEDFLGIEPFDSLSDILFESNNTEELIKNLENKFCSRLTEIENIEFNYFQWSVFAFDFVFDNIIRWQNISRMGLMESMSYSVINKLNLI